MSSGSGFKSTANFTDATDELTKAISGFDGGTNRSVLTFESTFRPAYAIAFLPGDGVKGTAVVVRMAENSPFLCKEPPSYTNNDSRSAANYAMVG